MEVHTKAVLASMVVLTLAVSTVGATHSWFSDTAEISTKVSTTNVDVDFCIIGDDGNGIGLAAGQREYSLRAVNHSTIGVSVEPSLEVVRHYAVVDANGYVCNVKQDADGWGNDAASSADHINGKAAWSESDSSGYMIQESFGGSAYNHFTGVNSEVAGASCEQEGVMCTKHTVCEAVYSISSGFVMEPGEVRDIQFELKVDSRCSIDSNNIPMLLVRASQSHEAGDLGSFTFCSSETVSERNIAKFDSLGFSCSNNSSVFLDNAATVSGWNSITVSLEDAGNVGTIHIEA